MMPMPAIMPASEASAVRIDCFISVPFPSEPAFRRKAGLSESIIGGAAGEVNSVAGIRTSRQASAYTLAWRLL